MLAFFDVWNNLLKDLGDEEIQKSPVVIEQYFRDKLESSGDSYMRRELRNYDHAIALEGDEKRSYQKLLHIFHCRCRLYQHAKHEKGKATQQKIAATSNPNCFPRVGPLALRARAVYT